MGNYQSNPLADYWYDHRGDLREGMVFRTAEGSIVKLDTRVPGDGTDWYVADWWNGSWIYEMGTIHPTDLREKITESHNPA